MSTNDRRTGARDRRVVVSDLAKGETERRVGAVDRRVELQAAWREANAPFSDTRPEMLEWREERRIEARNTLIEFCRTHREELPNTNYRDSMWKMLQRLLAWVKGPADSLAASARRAAESITEDGHPAAGSK